MVVPGVAVVGAGADMFVINTADGSTLFDYHLIGNPNNFLGAATIANGVLYMGNNNGNLYAFKPS